MKILNYGSLNIDLVYRMDHLVLPGETQAAQSFQRFCGGKGLNQSIALAKAGAPTRHAGNVGGDGGMLLEALKEAGVNVDAVTVGEEPSGHAIIQVERSGQNSIIIYAGANGCVTGEEIDKALADMEPGDWLLLQNEINNIPLIMEKAKKRGLKIAINPAPMDEKVKTYPLDLVDLCVVNETEAAALTGLTDEADALAALERTYPDAIHVVTLGSRGSMCSAGGRRYTAEAKKVDVVDTTAAGDTYIGYFLALLMEGRPVEACMETATRASAIAVSRMGAAPSIPLREEL